MWRPKARRRELFAGDRGRDHRAAMAMLAAERRVLGGIGCVIGQRRYGLPSRLGGTERTLVLSQVDKSDSQKCQSGNYGDRAAKCRSEKDARNQLFGGCGHPGK
jgi:hypothetical protein